MTSVKSGMLSRGDDIERIKTYIEKMDERLEGGIPKGTVSLICGSAGCMKTTLAYSILYNNAVREGLNGMYITLETDIESLKLQMKRLGMGEDTKTLIIVDHKMIGRESERDMRFELNWMKRIVNYVKDMRRKKDYELVAIDSLNALYSMTAVKNPRMEIYNFFEDLRGIGTTNLLISEAHRSDGRFSEYGIEDFLSDAIIHIDVRRKRDLLERYLGVIKMRYTKHDLQYFPLFYDKGRFIIYTKEELEL